jgi:UDP-N-acetylmuramate dehydrogenase
MALTAEAYKRLAAIPSTTVRRNEPLSKYTRFGIGGPAAVLADVQDENSIPAAWRMAAQFAVPRLIIGGGTNLVVSDAGFDGILLRYTGSHIERAGTLVRAAAGAVLQDVVDFSIQQGLSGIHTMTGIPGYLGGAVYGNAGAYGRSLHESVECVRATNGAEVRTFSNAECGFSYRESQFKKRKDWVILSAELRLVPADAAGLQAAANDIRTIRKEKYPPSMKCAGSIFKNLLFAQLPAPVQDQVPPKLVREGKVPSAWFLEQTGVKGMRVGDIQVAAYHANLIYNDGKGSAADLVKVIAELKRRVRDRFGFDLEEEVQYVGFANHRD